jgi:hypothetical protein
MAKRKKDRMYYEVTKEKPYGNFQLLMVGGSAGSVMGFLLASLVGAYEGMEMDLLVLVFLVASLLGFFFGALLMWLCTRYFGSFLSDALLMGGEAKDESGESMGAPAETGAAEEGPVVETDEAKGKSVDFVFPELSPDK